MPTTIRPSGITVETHGGATATGNLKIRRRRAGELPPRGAPATPTTGRGRRRMATTAAATPAPLTEEEALINAIEDQDLELIDAVPLGNPLVPPASGKRRRTTKGEGAVSSGPASADLNIPLAAGESAVVLVEQDGVYEWHVTGDVTEVAPPPPPSPGVRRRRTAATKAAEPAAPAITHSARFTITLAPQSATAAGTLATSAKRRKLGMVKKYLLGKAVAYVFTFIAKPILSGLARFQERNVREGLVHVVGNDPSQWVTLADTEVLPLPTSRAAKVLLLVHGTFSSTIGSFGALAGHDTGLAFLEGALANYDLILGFDHRTLSVTPTENAIDIITRLDQLGFTEPPTVDAIAFSRGGLVLRSLIEEILPSHPNKFTVRRAVFVACTNGGTELANPNNWNRFLDRYTNLAAAGSRIVSYVPQFTHGAMIFGEAVKGVGALLKGLVSTAKTGNAVPGLEAMDPTGDFVAYINEAQPGQPEVADTYYCAITSDFDPDAAAKELDPHVLPAGVLLRIGDKLTDELYGKPNDLVVHVESMTHIDPLVGAFVRDRLDFGTNGHVFHTTYFHQAETANALIRWFGILATPAITAEPARRRTASAKKTPTKRATTRRGTATALTAGHRGVVSKLPSDTVVLRSTMRVGAAIGRVEASKKPWVVVERGARDREGKAVSYLYAHPRSAASEMLHSEFLAEQATVHDAFNLRETKASDTVINGPTPVAKALDAGMSPKVLQGSFGSRYRSVVIGKDRPMRVVPAVEDDDLPMAMPTAKPESQPGLRRGGRTTATAKKSAARPSADKPAATKPAAAEVALNVRAVTDDEYVIDRSSVVAVTLSREALAAVTAGVQQTRTAKVKATLPLIVECLPMTKTSMLNEGDGRVEIPVPSAGEPTELRFDVVGREAGEALIKVQVRQGPFPLVTLSLEMAVVAQRTGARREVVGDANIASFPEIPAAMNELRIVQMSPTSTSAQYRFELRLPTKRVQKEFVTSELTTDAQTYIDQLYARIEDRWVEHGSEKDAFARDLRAIGSDLFDDLLPLELRQLLWKHRDAINSVQVLSSEPFIPWELVYLRDPAKRKPTGESAFLGELGVVRWLMHDYPPEQLTISKKNTRYVIPEYEEGHELPEAQAELDMVTARFQAKPVTAEAESIYELISEPGRFDLLHIACHGTAESTNIGSASLEMPGKLRSDDSMSEENVMADTVRREADLHDEATGKQPIVVLNACQSARAGYGLKGIGGFAEAFVAGGAGVFIGSSWSVGDVPARAFIEEFYAQFLSGKGKRVTLSQAVAKARSKARADGDATWLAYVVYGHPRAVATLVP